MCTAPKSSVLRTKVARRACSAYRGRVRFSTLSSVLVLLSLSVGCVPKARYDAALNRMDTYESEGTAARAEIGRLTRQLDAKQVESQEQGAKLETYEEQIAKDSRSLADLEKQLAQMSSTNTEVGERLRIAGKTLTEIATERQKLTLAVNDARACLSVQTQSRARVDNTGITRARR